MEMSSLVLTIQLLGYLILTHTYPVVRRELRSYGYSYSLLNGELRSHQEFPNHILDTHFLEDLLHFFLGAKPDWSSTARRAVFAKLSAIECPGKFIKSCMEKSVGKTTWLEKYQRKTYQWELQDPKMEVLYHIRPYFVGIFPYIGLKNRPYIW